MDRDTVNNYKTTPILSDPIINDGIIYISVNEKIYALDSQTYESPETYAKEKTDTMNYDILLIALFIVVIILIFIRILIYRKKKNGGMHKK
jgi:hypothetical protein